MPDGDIQLDGGNVADEPLGAERAAPERPGLIAERMLTRLKIKQLRLLVAVDRHGSILGAAAEIAISQPAATKLVKDMEADFGVQLFERTNRGVVPTPHGRALARHAGLVLAQLHHAAEEMEDLSEGRGGQVAVGTLLAASARLLPRALARLTAERPGVRIAVRDGTNDVLMPMLARGELDLVVGRLPEYRHRRGLVQERLMDDALALVCRSGHPLAAHDGAVPLAIVAEQPFVMQPYETTIRRQIERAFADRGIDPPHAAVETVSFLTMRELLRASDMLAVLPAEVAERDRAADVLHVLACDPVLPSGTPIGVSYRQGGALAPAASVLLDALRAVADT